MLHVNKKTSTYILIFNENNKPHKPACLLIFCQNKHAIMTLKPFMKT